MTGWLAMLASAAFAAGLMGGLHCAAMCGPIAAGCATGFGRARAPRWRLALAYNGGRIMSYTLAGALAGGLGQASLLVRGGVYAQSVMLTLASATLMLLALYMAGFARVSRGLEAAGGLVWRRVQPMSRRFLPGDTLPRALALGAVWGWLPCGMVYAVLLTAVATAHAGEGALVMLAFGVGTLPNVLAIAVLARRVQGFTRRRAVRLGLAAAMAILAAIGLLAALGPAHAGLADLLCRLAPLSSVTFH